MRLACLFLSALSTLAAAPEDLMLLVVSDLTGDLALAGPARAALIAETQKLPMKTWPGLLRAQDGLQVMLDPGSDREAFAKALNEVPISGKSGLLDSVETAASLADRIASKAAVRVAILYVTDSNVRNYREDFTNPVINSSDSRDLSRRFADGLVRDKTSRLAKSLSGRKAPVFIVHLQYSSDRLDKAYQDGLEQIAAATGGFAVICRTPADIAGAVGQAVEAAQR